MVNIGVREVKMLEVIATTEKGEVNFGNFFVESEWEGMTKLKSVKNGSVLVVSIEKLDIGSMIESITNKFATQPLNKISIIRGSPDLLSKLAELEGK